VCFLQFRQRIAVQQVAAEPEVDDRADDERFLDPAPGRPGVLVRGIHRELKRPLRVAFPEVRTRTQPVVIVLTGREDSRSGEDVLADLPIAAVKAEDERGVALVEPPHVGV